MDLVRVLRWSVVVVVLGMWSCKPPAVLRRGGAEVPSADASARVGVAVKRAQRTSLRTRPQALARQLAATSKASARMTLELFDDTQVLIEQIEVRDAGPRRVIVGRPAGPAPGWAYLVVEGDALSGVVRVGATDYRLLSTGAGEVLVSEIDANAYPRELPPRVPAGASGHPLIAAHTAAAHAAPEHDVLVLYTPMVESALGAANVGPTIDLAIVMANDAYANSGIDQRVRLAHAERVSYTESGDLGDDLDRLQATNDGTLDEIHRIRDRFGADLVVLLVQNGGDCGIANLAVISSDADDDSAFSVVQQGCITNHTFAHELGHVSGAHHDTWVDPTPFPGHAHGYVPVRADRNPDTGVLTCTANPAGEWRTIMAYRDKCDACGVTCPRAPNFSNPSVTHADGRAMGNGGADNARRLNETAITLEGFRLRGQRVSLYEGNRGTQDHVCVVSTGVDDGVDFTGSSDFRFCDNDEARSLRLFEVPAGRVIRLFDDPGGSTQDDWVEIAVKRAVDEKLIETFERSFEDDDVRVEYHRNNGLDGKVSRLQVSGVASGPMLDLHEGNDARQNLVCTLHAAQTTAARFPGHADCDNDEARSLTLRGVPAGTVVRLFDDPDGGRGDDWTEIEVLRDVSARVIGTFERSTSDADVRVTYHRHNGLDGKVSRLEVASQTSGPWVDLHEGNRGTQDLVCSFAAPPSLARDFTAGGDCDNDEARSLTLHDAPAGTMLLLFDSPGGNQEDDWVAIEAKRDVVARTVDSFERTFEDDDLRVVYLRNNGLDGKVSRLEVTRAGALQGMTTWYEGNHGSQNKVCDLPPVSQTVRFKSHDACDNDEARSLMLTLVQPGVRLQVFDNPDCRTNDDWTEIEIKRAIFRKTIGSFERSFEDDDVRVVHHHDNGLDGKVSCVKIIR